MRALALLMLLSASSALAGSAAEVDAAREDLASGRIDEAARRLRQVTASPEDLKDKNRGPAFVLLAEAALAQSDHLAYDGGADRAVRDLRLEALQAGRRAAREPLEPAWALRATAAVDRARTLLVDAAVDHLRGDEPEQARGWIEGLRGVEGDSLEVAALEGMRQARRGTGSDLGPLQAATRAADEEGAPIRTADLGYAYLALAEALLARDPDAHEAALAVLERGLAWQARAGSRLDETHDLPLRKLQRALQDARLDRLMALPQRRTEALYAVEAALAESPDNLAMLLRLGPWLEAWFPDRAIVAWQRAQQAMPDQAALPHHEARLHLARSEATAADLRRARDPEARDGLRLRYASQLREARDALEQAARLAPEDNEIAAELAEVERRLGD